MQLLAADLEAAHCGDHYFDEQGGAIRLEEPVQGSADAIVGHLLHHPRLQAVHLGSERAHGLLLLIDGLPLYHDGAQQHA